MSPRQHLGRTARRALVGLRPLLGRRVWCPWCGHRLDIGHPLFAVLSPSRLTYEHAPECQHPALRAARSMGPQDVTPPAVVLAAVAEALTMPPETRRTAARGMEAWLVPFRRTSRRRGSGPGR